MRWTLIPTVMIAFWIAAGGAALAEPTPVFGPWTFESTSVGPDLYSETFATDRPGPWSLILINGDHESSRVDGAVIRVDGNPVVGAGELDETVDGLTRRVLLHPGEHELEVEVTGMPGSFLTLALARPAHPPVFVHGRLVLPWGRHDGSRSLALALKNGSPRFPRAFRVLFLSPGGHVVAASERITLPPRGSLALPLGELIDPSLWPAGSVEVVFSGPGLARMFGTARQVGPVPGESDLLPLEPAGLRVHR